VILIGVDIGTQGTKTGLYDQDGTLLAEAMEPSMLRRPSQGVVEEDANRQVMSVCRTVKQCIEESGSRPADIAAIAIDGQMAGIIGVNAEGEAVTPYDSWLDTRCAPQIERMKDEAADQITRKTGCAPSFNHGPKILWWMEEHPETFAQIASFVQPGGYAAMKLCGIPGREGFIDKSYLHFSGFADNPSSRWDSELSSQFGVPEEKLPRIVGSHDVVGHVTGGMSRLSGLPAGLPVVAGCGDTAASFLSCGATQEGVCVDVAGTASVFAATTQEFRADTHRLVLGCGQSAVPGLWHPYAYINGGGMNLEWFTTLVKDLGAETTSLTLDGLNALAADIADPTSLPYFIPHFGGRVTPAMPRLRGAWVGLDWSHGVGELYRAMLESVAMEYAVYRNVLATLYPDLELQEIRVTGGGQKSQIWNEIKATVLGTPVASIAGGGGAPMGSAMLAGFGVGVFADLNQVAQRWVSIDSRTNPDPELHGSYQTRTEKYEELIEILNRFHES
jgi:xylulokinase